MVELDAQDEGGVRGLDRAEALLANDIARNRVASAYLIAGIEGIGKASLAFRAAATLLCPKQPQEPSFDLFGDPTHDDTDADGLMWDKDSPSYERMKQRTHPDFLWITPPYDEKKKQFKREITIEQIRNLSAFLTLTSGESDWKVIIIDAADAMNHSAMNGLLKWLEEPPTRTVFFLISHREGALLQTIHSRCRRILCAPPSLTLFAELMYMSEHEARDLYRLSGGSIGLAKQWQAMQWRDYVDAWNEIRTLSPHAAGDKTQALAERMAKNAELSLAHVLALWSFLVQHDASRLHQEITMEMHEHIQKLVQNATIFHLDKRHVIQYMLRH